MRMLSILMLLLPSPVLGQRLIVPQSKQPLPAPDISDAVVIIERGTGFIIDGFIVTASHVVACHNPEVKFKNGKVLKATIVLHREELDLLVLKVDGPLPKGLRWGDAAKAGDRVSFIGHPQFDKRSYPWSHSSGVVSAVGRTVPMPTGQKIAGMIQLDANVNNGNSGGPLLDAAGRCIGLIVAYDASASGIGFALNGKAIEAAIAGAK